MTQTEKPINLALTKQEAYDIVDALSQKRSKLEKYMLSEEFQTMTNLPDFEDDVKWTKDQWHRVSIMIETVNSLINKEIK